MTTKAANRASTNFEGLARRMPKKKKGTGTGKKKSRKGKKGKKSKSKRNLVPAVVVPLLPVEEPLPLQFPCVAGQYTMVATGEQIGRARFLGIHHAATNLWVLLPRDPQSGGSFAYRAAGAGEFTVDDNGNPVNEMRYVAAPNSHQIASPERILARQVLRPAAG